MTPEEQRAALAKALAPLMPGNNKGFQADILAGRIIEGNDLNAMAAATASLSHDQHYQYRAALWEITKAYPGRFDGINGEAHNRRYCDATAAQRAEAFLRTLSLWSDTKGGEKKMKRCDNCNGIGRVAGDVCNCGSGEGCTRHDETAIALWGSKCPSCKGRGTIKEPGEPLNDSVVRFNESQFTINYFP